MLLMMSVLAALSYGQNQILTNGYNKFYYPDGSISSEGTLRNGKPDGFWKTYYPNGVLKSAGNRVNYELDSVWLFFDETGDTTSLINYNYGKKNGYSVTYTTYQDSVKHNVPKAKELYRDDKKQGFSFYYEKGLLNTEIPYKDDRKHGEGYQYNDKGDIVAILTYKYGDLVDKDILNRLDEKGLKQGVFKTFYPDKKVRTECYYKDDLLNGYYREFDTRGRQVKIERWINGKRVVENKNSLASSQNNVKVKNEFYADGTLKKSGAYKDSIPVGVHRTYNEKGKINGAVTYNDEGKKIADGIVDGRGREQGKWTLFDSIGAISGKGIYKNGKREGEWIFYFSDGATEQQGVYKDGKPEGKWVWYYPNGNIRRVENYVNGLEEGDYYELTVLGDSLQTGIFTEGEKDGMWTTKTGDALVYENFKFGTLQGDYKVYYLPSNKLKIDAKYLQGNLHGKYREYFESGKIHIDGQYMSGKEDGQWRIYDEDGLLDSDIEYSQGEIVKVDGAQMPKK